MNMNNLLDPNFYTSIPEWIYIISGFGIIAVCNSIYFCCHSCKYKRRIEKLKIKEFDVEKREIELDRRLEIERKEKELIRREKQKEERKRKKEEEKGKVIAGLILCSIALIFGLIRLIMGGGIV